MSVVRTTRRMAVATAFIMLTAPVAHAASFNCARAATADEVAICSNSALSDLDVELATLFRVRMQVPMLMGERGAAQDEQREWLFQRSACGADVACLSGWYQTRIQQLDAEISNAMEDYCTHLGICG